MLASRIVIGTALLLAAALTAHAETLPEALVSAYANNATLNANRALVRATDEAVPLAKTRMRPFVTAEGNYGASDTTFGPSGDNGRASLSVTQNLFRGFRTRNDVLGAEASILAAREGLRSTEQSILLNATTAYMDVIRNSRIVQLNNSNLEFLSFEVRAANDRFEVGDGTRTDIALAEGALQRGRADLFSSQSNLDTSIGTYRQVIGIQPRGLKVNDIFARRLPATLEAALHIGLSEHPDIMQAEYRVDQQLHAVKSTEGQLLPTLSVSASLSRSYSQPTTNNSASVTGRLSIPLYQGGGVHASIRQEKESLGQARINVDVARDQVRANIVSAWGSLLSSRSSIKAAVAQVRARKLAVAGVVEERRVGQATTLDVLDIQSDLIAAQITLARAERNLVVAGAALLSTIGRLNTEVLSLNVQRYDPASHARLVKNKFIGVRTPDGR